MVKLLLNKGDIARGNISANTACKLRQHFTLEVGKLKITLVARLSVLPALNSAQIKTSELRVLALGFTDAEYLGAATGANPLCCRAFVLECYGLGVLNLYLFSALHTISLHFPPPLLSCQAE